MSVPRRVPEVGEVINLTEYSDLEPSWYVRNVEWTDGYVMLHLELLLDQRARCILMLPTATLGVF